MADGHKAPGQIIWNRVITQAWPLVLTWQVQAEGQCCQEPWEAEEKILSRWEWTERALSGNGLGRLVTLCLGIYRAALKSYLTHCCGSRWTHPHAHTYLLTHTHIVAHTHLHTHLHTHTLTHALTHMLVCSHYTHSHTYLHVHTCLHIRVHTRALVHSHPALPGRIALPWVDGTG